MEKNRIKFSKVPGRKPEPRKKAKGQKQGVRKTFGNEFREKQKSWQKQRGNGIPTLGEKNHSAKGGPIWNQLGAPREKPPPGKKPAIFRKKKGANP